MNWSGKRIIVACTLAATLGLMLCPPVRVVYNAAGRSYSEHRMLWDGRGTLDWSRLALEFCLLAVVAALVAAVLPTLRPASARAPRVWLRRAGLVLAFIAGLILAVTAGHDGIIRIASWREYNRKVQEFRAKAPLLQAAFPLHLSPTAFANGYQIVWITPISNVHEAEIILRSMGCDDRSIHQATAEFLSASAPEYDAKSLRFVTGISDGKSGNCQQTLSASDVEFERPTKANAPRPQADWFEQNAPAAPKATASPTNNGGWTLAQQSSVTFEFRINDSDAGKQFFAPLPNWYVEALQQRIEVGSVPDWMKPGEPPASWSFTEWLDRRSAWLIPASGMLALCVIGFVVGRRIDATAASTTRSAGGVRSD